MTWNTIDIWDTVDTKLKKIIAKALPAPFYNPAKGTPQLVKEWTSIEQYLQIGEIKEQILDETVMTLTEEQLQEIQEMADLYHNMEETSEEEEEVIITKYKRASLRQKEKTPKKGVQFGDLPKGGTPKKQKNPDKGKDKDKETTKDQSTSGGDDPGDDSSSSSESCNRRESDSEDESKDNTRQIRQLSPSQKEWEQVTGKKTLGKGKNKINNNKSLVKLPTLEMFDGTNKKQINPTTFD